MAGPTLDSGRFSPGTLLTNRYRIVSLLGRGGMGEVYRVEDLTLGQTVALKFLPAALARSEEQRALFLREVRAARQVSHPNVCRVYDTGEVDGELFLSMEYIDGEDLASLLRRIGRLPQDKALDLARQLCAGLAAAHSRGVLHRDLKPANVMIDGQGNARITDFGLAGLAGELEGDRIAGTPAYMAPELFATSAAALPRTPVSSLHTTSTAHAGAGTASARSDIYALGLVLYEMFGGRPAFRAETLGELVRLHAESTPSSLAHAVSDLDPLVDRIILRCLAKNPEDRPASALEVSAALPGGDPLAAALARGETPSPQVVAAAGGTERISPAAGLMCLAATIAGLGIVVALSAKTQVMRIVPLDKPPAVLADRAQDTLARFGYPEAQRYSATGFIEAPYLSWIRDHDRSVTRWENLRKRQPPGVLFWFRQSPRPLVLTTFVEAGRATPEQPPVTVPGMATVILDPAGALRFLTAMPPRADVTGDRTSFDWAPLFHEAGFDPGRFTPAEPTWMPPLYAERRAAWDGAYPERPDIRIHVEAAETAGRPVYFEIFDPSSPSPLMDQLAVEMAPSAAGVVLQLLLVGGAALLAWRNSRRGRGDRAGAFRLASFICVVHLAASVLGAHSAAHPLILATFLARGLLLAAFVWMVYMALEPFLRRHWPTTMISWTRLLAGRLNDPLVGRDVLIGVVAGVAQHLLWQLGLISPAWGGAPPLIAMGLHAGRALEALSGLRFNMAALLNATAGAVPVTTSFVLVFFLLTILLRKRWIAAIAFTALLSAEAFAERGLALVFVFVPLTYVLMTFVLLRFGLLAMVVSALLAPVLDHQPLTLDTGAWFASASWLVLAFVVGLAVYGLRTALAGRPMFSSAFLHE